MADNAQDILDNAARSTASGGVTRTEFVDAIALLAGSVYDFHDRFDIPNLYANRTPDACFERLVARLAFLMEEVGEHSRELNRANLTLAAEEMADVAFVALGTILELDGSGVFACRDVANKNDNKTLQTHTFETSSGKLVKRSTAQ